MDISAVEARRVVARAGLIHRDVGEQLFLLLPDGTMHWLKNATAVALWRALVAAGPEGARLDALSRVLTRLFAVEEGRAHEDVQRFVETLADRGLVLILQTPGASEGPIDLPE